MQKAVNTFGLAENFFVFVCVCHNRGSFVLRVSDPVLLFSARTNKQIFEHFGERGSGQLFGDGRRSKHEGLQGRASQRIALNFW